MSRLADIYLSELIYGNWSFEEWLSELSGLVRSSRVYIWTTIRNRIHNMIFSRYVKDFGNMNSRFFQNFTPWTSLGVFQRAPTFPAVSSFVCLGRMFFWAKILQLPFHPILPLPPKKLQSVHSLMWLLFSWVLLHLRIVLRLIFRNLKSISLVDLFILLHFSTIWLRFIS